MNRAAGIRLSVLGILILLAACALTFWVFSPDSWKYSALIALGNRDAQKINAYRQRTGHLPASLVDIGEVESESGPIYYERCDDTRYMLWFGTTLGESMTFDSARRSWDSLNSVCPQPR